MKIRLFIIFISLFPISVFSQNKEIDFSIVKAKIETHYKNKNINAINDLINKDKSLEYEYVFEILNRNLEYSKKNDNQEDIATTYLLFGNFWHQQANKIKAFENYIQAETISKKIKNHEILGTTLMNKSTLLDNNIDKINTLKEASKFFESTKDTINIIKIFMNIGVAYGKLYATNNDSIYSHKEIAEFKQKSFDYYKKAEKLNQHLKNPELSGVLHIYYGEWFMHQKQFEQANESFQKAQKILIETNNIKAQAYCVLILAKIATEQDKFSKAIQLLKEAERLSGRYKFNDYLVRIYDEYVKLYTEQNDLSKALIYSKLYADKSIELAEQSNNDKMQILSLEKNIAENKLQLNEYEADSKMNRVLIIVSLLIALLITGISYLIIKNNKRKINSIEQNKIITELEKSAVEIKLKNQLLEDELLKEKVKYSQNNLITFANQVNKIDTFLDDLKSEMKGNLNSEEKQEKINSLKISFSEVLSNQNELKQINSLSSELNQEFFFHIRKNYPSITKEDEQLLSYLILNLSNKEISKKLNISIKSLYTKRYRLRKKLDLEENEKLLDFYKKVIDEFVA